MINSPTLTEKVLFRVAPVNKREPLIMSTCPAAKPCGNIPAGNPETTLTTALPNNPSRTTVTDGTESSRKGQTYVREWVE